MDYGVVEDVTSSKKAAKSGRNLNFSMNNIIIQYRLYQLVNQIKLKIKKKGENESALCRIDI